MGVSRSENLFFSILNPENCFLPFPGVCRFKNRFCRFLTITSFFYIRNRFFKSPNLKILKPVLAIWKQIVLDLKTGFCRPQNCFFAIPKTVVYWLRNRFLSTSKLVFSDFPVLSVFANSKTSFCTPERKHFFCKSLYAVVFTGRVLYM